MVSGIPGPVAGMLTVVVAQIDLNTADNIASLVDILVYPLTTIASTLLYLQIGDPRSIAREPKPAEPRPVAGPWLA